MSAFVLKLIAIIAMTFDHIGAVFFPLGLRADHFCYSIALRTVGRFTMPIMCFFIGEGYRKTGNKGKYALRLLLFAFISEIPYRLLLHNEVNVIFTLFIGLCGLWVADILKERFKSDSFRIFVYLFAVLAAMLIDSDWSYIGMLLIFAFYHGGDSTVKRILYPLSVYVFVFISGYIEAVFVVGFESFYINFIQFAGCLSIPLLLLYNGKKGPSMKYLFYIYYPLHMLVLWLLHMFIPWAIYNWG